MNQLPPRTPLDLAVDRAFHELVTSPPQLREVRGKRFHEAVAQRNLNRTPEQIAALELDRGLA
jgi:hypothetical protein